MWQSEDKNPFWKIEPRGSNGADTVSCCCAFKKLILNSIKCCWKYRKVSNPSVEAPNAAPAAFFIKNLMVEQADINSKRLESYPLRGWILGSGAPVTNAVGASGAINEMKRKSVTDEPTDG